MEAVKEQWKQRVAEALREVAVDHQIDPLSIEADSVVVETPPTPELGDIAFPLFPFARIFKTAPAKIAAEVAEKLTLNSEAAAAGTVQVAGPYLNVALKMVSLAGEVCASVLDERDSYGRGQSLQGTKVMVEFSCPNTNKPLHLGHLRNDALGESVARILGANGADVMKVNLINDRGIHICKSMLAYKKFGEGTTPESTGVKSDHFVGDYYVKFDRWSKEDEKALPEAQKMLQDWESGDPEVTALWKQMNKWTIDGIQETYEATGIEFDKFYYESETYSSGKSEVLK